MTGAGREAGEGRIAWGGTGRMTWSRLTERLVTADAWMRATREAKIGDTCS